MTATAPTQSVGDLVAADDIAWGAYGEACHDPLATDTDRARLFQYALTTMTAVMRVQPDDDRRTGPGGWKG